MLKLSITALALAALTAVASAAPQDHHCKLPDGSYDVTKTQKQCTDAKGTWDKDATFTGTFKTGINAIGGETTGMEITTDKGTYEVDLGGDKDMTAAAGKLDGKKVTITGVLTTKKGVEIKERHIVVASTLAAGK
jgi:hypothetical protein